jgi:hypothetical protein
MSRKLFICLALLTFLVPVAEGCDCGASVYGTIPDAGTPDAGEPAEPEPPVPPVFPLKEDDIVEVPVIGGRIEPCDGIEGDCDRVASASYTIQDVFQDEETGHWTINADYLYTLEKANASFESIARLFISRVAPLDTLLNQYDTSSGNADFSTNGSPSDQITANGFPFFHFESAYANESGSAYQHASTNFTVRITTIDPQAEIQSQSAAQTIEAYFKDNLGASTYLHFVSVELHPFGFMCYWQEKMIDWSDELDRGDSSFASGQGVPLAASFNTVYVIRDDVRYRCGCFANTCEATVDGVKQCLDASDPDAAPSEENCN